MIGQHRHKTVEESYEPWRVEIESNAMLIPDEYHMDITRAIRYYAFHFDTYLNAACRNRPFPIKRLLIHFENDIKIKSDSGTNPNQTHERTVDSIFDEACFHVSDPFRYIRTSSINPLPLVQDVEEDEKEMFTMFPYDSTAMSPEEKGIMFDYYVAMIKSEIYFMFQTMVRFSFTTDRAKTLYRGLVLLDGQEVQPFRGFSSCSYHLESIYDIFMFYESKLTKEIPTYVLLVMEVPFGVRYLPSSICTLFGDENEIILLSQLNIIEPHPSRREVYSITMNKKHFDIQCRYVQLEVESLLPRLHEFKLSEQNHFWGRKNSRKRK